LVLWEDHQIAETLWLSLAIGCASVFGVSAFMKLLHEREWRTSLAGYRIGWLLATRVATIVPLVELATAGGLARFAHPGIAAAGGMLSLGFAVVLGAAYRRGARGDCGCFGGVFRSDIGPGAVIRALCLAAACFLVALAPPNPDWHARAVGTVGVVLVTLLAIEARTALRPVSA